MKHLVAICALEAVLLIVPPAVNTANRGETAPGEDGVTRRHGRTEGRAATQSAKAGAARTVWDGVFTALQAQRGRIAYTQACASCHAGDLRGHSTAPSLVEESFAFQWEDMSVGDLFVRTRTLMPSDRPNSLSGETYRDIVAFLLESNKFPPGEQELDADADALRQILITTKRP
jgi:S-disulfanyl-L-cysteine oxidoreductase SoxD